MTWLCPRPCENKTADGYCGTSWCINPMYSNIGTANEKLMGGLRKTTNADRIRGMTDEELAKLLTDVAQKSADKLCESLKTVEVDLSNCDFHILYEAHLDWLKQEAEE